MPTHLCQDVQFVGLHLLSIDNFGHIFKNILPF